MGGCQFCTSSFEIVWGIQTDRSGQVQVEPEIGVDGGQRREGQPKQDKERTGMFWQTENWSMMGLVRSVSVYARMYMGRHGMVFKLVHAYVHTHYCCRPSNRSELYYSSGPSAVTFDHACKCQGLAIIGHTHAHTL